MNHVIVCPKCGCQFCQWIAECCPEKESCPPSGICNTAYAQYSLVDKRASNTFLAMNELIESGGLTGVEQGDTIQLAAGYIYYVDYTVLASPGNENYFQIVPFINDNIKLLYGTFGSANTAKAVSISSGFLISETAENTAALRLHLTYSENVQNIDLTGVISIFPIAVTENERN